MPAPARSVKRDLTSGSLGWNLFRLAAPAAVGALMHSVYSLVDAFWLGKVGTIALNAPGLTGPLFFIVLAAGWGLGVGGTALVAQYAGSKQDRQADRAAAQTILLLMAVVATLVAPVVVAAPQILRLLQAPPESIPAASAYLRVFMLGFPFIAFTMAYGSVLRALGDTITVVVISVLANAVNLVLDPLLIFGWAGLPAMGVRGAALASVISQGLAAAGCLACLLRGRGGLHVTLADFRPDRAVLRHIVQIGTPAMVSAGANSVGFTAFQALTVNPFGVEVVGAFAIGWRVLQFFNVPMHAMASAAAPVVGQALGAGKVPLARRAVRVNARIYALLMALPILFVTWQGRFVARVFSSDPAVIAEAGRFFLALPLSVYFFGITMMLMSAFYGSGHTKPVMFVSIIRVWIVRIPAAYVLAHVVGLGSLGAYLGMVTGNIVSACVALALFLAGGWESAVVALPDDSAEAGSAD